jgi:hypothetical protein
MGMTAQGRAAGRLKKQGSGLSTAAPPCVSPHELLTTSSRFTRLLKRPSLNAAKRAFGFRKP